MKQMLFIFEVLVHRYEKNKINNKIIFCFVKVLKCICSYFAYKIRYSNSFIEIPEFPIASENALEILMAANFLDC